MRRVHFAHTLSLIPLTHKTILELEIQIFVRVFLKMSSRKGDARKKGQKYQNSTAFKNNLHDTSRMTKLINSTDVVGVCARCKDAIEWRKKFKKYKPLKAPKKWFVG